MAERGGGIYAFANSALKLLDSRVALNNAVQGAGVYIDTSAVDAERVVVAENSATESGGGVVLTGATSSLRGVTIQECAALHGGGVAVGAGTHAQLAQLDIARNEATDEGGGIHVTDCELEVASVRAEDNTAKRGGGLFAQSSTVAGTLTLALNRAELGGGAELAGSTTLEKTAFDANSATGGGGGIYAADSVVTLRDVDVQSCESQTGVGGGAYFVATHVQHDRVVVSSCSADSGGGVYLDGSTMSPPDTNAATSATALQLALNTASSLGGGMYIAGSNVSVDALAVVGGMAASGGGIALENADSCVLTNVVVQNATATSLGGGMFVGTSADCVVIDALLELNSAGKAGGGLAVYQGTLRHSNVVIQNNIAKHGGGLHVSTSAAAKTSAVLTQWSDATSKQSLVNANALTSDAHNGANVLIECATMCQLSGVRVARGEVLSGRGGGMYVSGRGKVLIAHVVVEHNYAQSGGGVFIKQASSTTIAASVFTHNGAEDGAGLSIESARASLAAVNVTTSVFYNNSAKSDGGAMRVSGATLSAASLLVLENRATMNDSGIGGGIHALAESVVEVDASLFLLNQALYGGSVAVDSESDASINASVVTGDTTRLTPSWAALFKRAVGVEYVPKRANAAFTLIEARRGDLVYVHGENTVLNVSSSFVTFGRAESGGGVSVETTAVLRVTDSELAHNHANESGGSVFVSGVSAKAYLDQSTIRSSSTCRCDVCDCGASSGSRPLSVLAASANVLSSVQQLWRRDLCARRGTSLPHRHVAAQQHGRRLGRCDLLGDWRPRWRDARERRGHGKPRKGPRLRYVLPLSWITLLNRAPASPLTRAVVTLS